MLLRPYCCPVLQGGQFGLAEVEVVTADVDLDEVVSYRWVCRTGRTVPFLGSSPLHVSWCSAAVHLQKAVHFPHVPDVHTRNTVY